MGTDPSTASVQLLYSAGRKAGAVVEIVGIRPNMRYNISKRDVNEKDPDLLYYLGKVLNERTIADLE